MYSESRHWCNSVLSFAKLDIIFYKHIESLESRVSQFVATQEKISRCFEGNKYRQKQVCEFLKRLFEKKKSHVKILSGSYALRKSI